MTNFCDRNNNIKKKRNIDVFTNYTTRQMDKMGIAVGTFRPQFNFSYYHHHHHNLEIYSAPITSAAIGAVLVYSLFCSLVLKVNNITVTLV